MAILYDKMLKRMKLHGITSYTCRRDGIMGQATWRKIQEGGHIDTRTLDSLCKYLKCQPGDLLEYRESKEEG